MVYNILLRIGIYISDSYAVAIMYASMAYEYAITKYCMLYVCMISYLPADSWIYKKMTHFESKNILIEGAFLSSAITLHNISTHMRLFFRHFPHNSIVLSDYLRNVGFDPSGSLAMIYCKKGDNAMKCLKINPTTCTNLETGDGLDFGDIDFDSGYIPVDGTPVL